MDIIHLRGMQAIVKESRSSFFAQRFEHDQAKDRLFSGRPIREFCQQAQIHRALASHSRQHVDLVILEEDRLFHLPDDAKRNQMDK